MPKLPPMKAGEELTAHRRAVPFSFWPTGEGKPRPPVQSLLFAIDPWVIMKQEIARQVTDANSKAEAISFIDQASDFYSSALNSGISAAKPLQLYYSYLNIVKAFTLCRGKHAHLADIRHGINENVPVGGSEFYDGFVQFWSSPGTKGKLQAYDEFLGALDVTRPINGQTIKISSLIPQILPGHRLWSMAAGEADRFIALERIQFIVKEKNIWLRIYVASSDIFRLNKTQGEILINSGLGLDFLNVGSVNEKGKILAVFEQMEPMKFGRHGVDVAGELANSVKSRLWKTVSTAPPYRRFYIYLCPQADRINLVPQLASIYAVTFYLGSVTRYRPNAFQEMLGGPYGARISEFVSGQPAQFVYLMASEFAKRDVTRPSIV